MTAIFADTSFFIALFSEADACHQDAVALAATLREPMLTTSAIVLELGAYMSRVPRRPTFARIMALLRDSQAEILQVDQLLMERALELFIARPDKDWSLADCTSFLVMEDRGATEAATSDEHFEQAGYVALLRKPAGKGG